MTRLAQNVRGRRGTAAVELAVAIPVVLLLTFATIDFGRIVYAYVVLANAARGGADVGSRHNFTPFSKPTWESRIEAAIAEEMSGLPSFISSLLDSTISTTEDSDGLFRVRVDLVYPFETVVNWPGIPAQTMLHRAVEMRQIR